MSMKPLLLAAALTAVIALPAGAEPVELVCNGKIHWYGENRGSNAVNGIHILVRDNTVEVSGTATFAATYPIDRDDSDAARLVFRLDLWGGALNRYSGELSMNKWTNEDQSSFDYWLIATCGKADPLF